MEDGILSLDSTRLLRKCNDASYQILVQLELWTIGKNWSVIHMLNSNSILIYCMDVCVVCNHRVERKMHIRGLMEIYYSLFSANA